MTPEINSESPSGSYRLLVLTDLHYGQDHAFRQTGSPASLRSLGDVVSDALATHFGTNEVDAIILAGDFFSRDQPADVALTSKGVKEILASIPHGHAVATPGNHDLVWGAPYEKDPFAFYNLLVSAAGLSAWEVDSLPALLRIAKPGLAPLELAVLDSCRLESEAMRGIGYFGPDQIGGLRALVSESTESPLARIAVFHHHVLPIWPRGALPEGHDPKVGPPPPISHTVDGIELLGALLEMKFAAAVHGHQHFPAVRRYEDLYVSQAPVAILAAGTAGTKGSSRHFFVLDIDATHLVVTSFSPSAANPDVFALDPARQAVRLELPTI